MCLRDPSRFVGTTRCKDRLQQLTSMGLKVVHFDLSDEATWSNLPPKSDIEATIFTFSILESQLSHLKRLWDKHLPVDRPVVCFGTSSTFGSPSDDHTVIINERSPLLGISVYTGTPLTDRVNGEKWVLSKGATVLHLSGLVSDEEEEKRFGADCLSSSRTIKAGILQSIKNGLRAVNLIHINDVHKISLHIIELLNKGDSVSNSPRGQRILTSCGAFRIQELLQAADLDSLPEIIPPARSKIVSIAKLNSYLPADYKWTMPVAGVKPCSRGLPTTDQQTVIGNGTAHDRQFELSKINFSGNWQGKSYWFMKDKGQSGDGKLNHEVFVAEMKALRLPDPVLTVEKTQYHIYYLDGDTFIWHGTGLRFGSGEKKLVVTRQKFNPDGKNFMFQGAAGQCSPNMQSDRFLFETNFFYERSRSMIIALYSLDSTSNKYLLDSIGIAPFRCGLGCNFPLKPYHQNRVNAIELVQSLRNKTCRTQWMNRTCFLEETEDGGELCQYPTRATQLFFVPERIVQVFEDDLVCSVPAEVCKGGPCELVYGCFHTPSYIQIILLTYDSFGKIEKYSLEKWS